MARAPQRARRRNRAEIERIIDACEYPGFEFKLGEDPAPINGLLSTPPRLWLQVCCPNGTDTKTGKPLAWKGRKWMLSYFMTDTEVVHTVWAAIQRALLHEASELFQFQGARIFDRHISVHDLAHMVSADPEGVLDGRVGE